MVVQNRSKPVRQALFIVLALNLSFWSISHKIYGKWQGVPPVPTQRGAVAMSLGDPQFSYRFLALALQNLGDGGAEVTPLKNYNYERLGKWFLLLHKLDPVSDHVPMIAAYYFGATKVPKDIAMIVDYLSVAGQVPVGEKWRWLAQAAYLAQHRMHNVNLALELAYKLTRMSQSGVDMPQWARQMPAFVLKNRGDKAAARQLMENMLVTEKNLHPAEVNFMQSYLIDELGVTPEEVQTLLRLREAGPVARFPGKAF